MAVSPLSINEFVGSGATCPVGINLVVPLAIGAFDRAAFLSAAELKGLYVVLVASTYLPAFQRMDAMDANRIADTIGRSDRQGWVLTMLAHTAILLVVALPSYRCALNSGYAVSAVAMKATWIPISQFR